jgi:uncharacterized membrane protein
MQKRKPREKQVCQICGAGGNAELHPGVFVRPAIGELIRRDAGFWDENGWICIKDLQRFRHKFVEEVLETERGELTTLEREVLESMKEQDTLSKNPEESFNAKSSFGERMADHIADFGGSWIFIGIFAGVIFFWLVLNSFILAARPFDPYPYILLNLVLSCLAAIQAPIIMMSQNRQEFRDRDRALHDYQVNLKAELEIRHLHQKLDHLMSHQWERLLNIQELQMELIDEMRQEKKPLK